MIRDEQLDLLDEALAWAVLSQQSAFSECEELARYPERYEELLDARQRLRTISATVEEIEAHIIARCAAYPKPALRLHDRIIN